MVENNTLKINILFLLSTAGIGGGERNLLYLASRLNSQKYNLFFIIPCEGVFADELRRRNYHFSILDTSPKFKLSIFSTIKKFILANNIQIVNAHGARMGFYAAIAAKLSKAPLMVYTIHASLYKYPVIKFIKWFYIFLDSLTLKLSDRIVCVSYALADEVMKNCSLNSKKIVVIHNGIDLNEFSHLRGASYLKREFAINSAQVIAAIGRLEDYKGQRYLLMAVRELVKTFPEIKCFFVGEGSKKPELKAKAEDFRISSNCIFTGDRLDVPEILSLIQVLVLPSLSEGHPFILLEAMAMLRPIVATRIGGVPEIIQDGKNGLLVAPRDPLALAWAIKRILEDPEEASRMAKAGRESVEKYYRVEQMISKMEELFESSLKEKLTLAKERKENKTNA